MLYRPLMILMTSYSGSSWSRGWRQSVISSLGQFHLDPLLSRCGFPADLLPVPRVSAELDVSRPHRCGQQGANSSKFCTGLSSRLSGGGGLTVLWQSGSRLIETSRILCILMMKNFDEQYCYMSIANSSNVLFVYPWRLNLTDQTSSELHLTA